MTSVATRLARSELLGFAPPSRDGFAFGTEALAFFPRCLSAGGRKGLMLKIRFHSRQK